MLEIRVTGLQELRARFRALEEVAQSRVVLAAAKAAMQPMADAAREDYPRSGTEEQRHFIGHLADSIRVFNLGKDSEYAPTGEGAVVAVSYDRRHYYGHFVEYGTVKMPANPVFRRAFEAHKDEAIEIFGHELRERIARRLGA